MDFLVSLIIWILVVYGAANILVFSALLKPVREWIESKSKHLGKLLKCIMCSSFHLGWILSLFYWSPSELMLLKSHGFLQTIIAAICDGFLASATSWLIFLGIADKMKVH